MDFSMFILLLAALLANVAPVTAFWRLLCHGQLGVVRVDSLADYGLISDHAHAVHGASNFGFTARYDDLLRSTCTSCSIIQDHSVYWTPPLYFQFDNGSFSLVPQLGGMTAYYFNDNAPGEKITAFPAGFAMVAGDARRRNFTLPISDPPMSLWTADDTTQSALAQKSLGFNCLNYTKGFATEGSMDYHYIRNKTFLDENCPDGLRLELMFPSCWDGKNVDSKNHKSHIQYPELRKTGVCPPGFPVRMPVLFYETIFDVYSLKNHSGTFVLSNGDPTGYGYHGDFLAGWEPQVLQKALDTCTSMSGLQEDCPVFTLQDESSSTSCSMEVPEILRDDDVHGPRLSLPGNRPIEPGPAYAAEILGTPLASSVPPAISSILTTAYTSARSALTSFSSTQEITAITDMSTTTFVSAGTVVVMVDVVQETTVTLVERNVAKGHKEHLARHGQGH